MDIVSVLLLACALAFGTLQVCDGREIIINEDTLIDTCTETCEEIPTLYDKHKCKEISGCKTNSEGWTRGFVRCDYCSCNCKENTANKDIKVEDKPVSITEPDLLDTCSKTCYRGGLVRSNFRKCQEVRDCYKQRSGWTRGFVRCDYCTCRCINRKYANGYRLANVKYDLSQIDLEQGAPIALAETILENAGNKEQTATRILTFSTSQTTTVATSHSMQIGLSVTVEASGGIPGAVSVSTSISRSLTYGFTYTAGSSKTGSKADAVSAAITVPPHSSRTATVTGHTVKIDVPYTADLVTTYEDGSTSTKKITGIYSDVETTRFRVQYAAAKPL